MRSKPDTTLMSFHNQYSYRRNIKIDRLLLQILSLNRSDQFLYLIPQYILISIITRLQLSIPHQLSQFNIIQLLQSHHPLLTCISQCPYLSLFSKHSWCYCDSFQKVFLNEKHRFIIDIILNSWKYTQSRYLYSHILYQMSKYVQTQSPTYQRWIQLTCLVILRNSSLLYPFQFALLFSLVVNTLRPHWVTRVLATHASLIVSLFF
jgi:hypothetical protein